MFRISKGSIWRTSYLIFMLFFVALPLLLVMIYAFQDKAGNFTFNHFARFVSQPESINTFLYSINVALITTIACIVLGYPAAYILSNKKLNPSNVTIILFILPMWINVLVRTLATVALFDFAKVPLGEGALIFGMVYDFLPFMIYPIYNVLQKIDPAYIEAAEDLGANSIQVFCKVVFPLSMPGILSGIMMVFMPTISTFAVAELLTMNKVKLFGTLIQDNINNDMWNYGAALALIMLVIISICMLLAGDKDENIQEGGLIE